MEANHNLTCPIAGEPALMSLRATLALALNQADHSPTGYTLDESDALDTMTATIEKALIQVDTLLGITEPADEDEDDAQAIAYNTEPVGSPWEKAQANAAADGYPEVFDHTFTWTIDGQADEEGWE